jgi:hypothetical protein
VTLAEPSALPLFSLVAGGPLYRLAQRTGLVRDERELARVGLVAALATWLPLLLLASAEGSLVAGGTMPFYLSVGTHARFLVAIPLLFAAEAWAGPRLTDLLDTVIESRLVPPSELRELEAAVRRARRSRDSTVAEVALLGLAAIMMVAGVRGDLGVDVSSWRTAGAGDGFGLAGWWYAVVSLPIFQFLLGRWGWRLLIWTVFLWRVSRLDLKLVPTHPDRAGGLGYLGVAQSHFIVLTVAVSTVLAAGFAEKIVFTGKPVQAFIVPVVGIVVLNAVLFLGPLAFFSARLLAVKRLGLREYGVLAAGYVHAFDARWLRGGVPVDESILGAGDIQSLADLANSYEVIRHMRIVPFGPSVVLALTAAATAPMLPLLLLKFRLDELLVGLVRYLFGA